MTNHEKYRLYTSEHPAADIFVDASWLYLISSALQRRVWIDSQKLIWPNQYIFFVAKPGKGKSITDIPREFLSYYKKDGTPNTANISEEKITSSPLLFPLSATSTTTYCKARLRALLSKFCVR